MKLFRRKWEIFFEARITRIIKEKNTILDIGGGLRLSREHSNRIDHRHSWIVDRMNERSVTYRILDYVDTYKPDIVGDIQHLPLPDNSEDAIICMSVLEHVENPFLAANEMYRTLKPGGFLFLYVPFLYYYHAEHGYYGDYWRFTEEALRTLCRDFDTFEIHPARGAVETMVRLSPLGRLSFMCNLGFLADKLFHKEFSKQTSGYYVFAIK